MEHLGMILVGIVSILAGGFFLFLAYHDAVPRSGFLSLLGYSKDYQRANAAIAGGGGLLIGIGFIVIGILTAMRKS